MSIIFKNTTKHVIFRVHLHKVNASLSPSAWLISSDLRRRHFLTIRPLECTKHTQTQTHTEIDR